jgi:hypothetical protein
MLDDWTCANVHEAIALLARQNGRVVITAVDTDSEGIVVYCRDGDSRRLLRIPDVNAQKAYLERTLPSTRDLGNGGVHLVSDSMRQWSFQPPVTVCTPQTVYFT